MKLISDSSFQKFVQKQLGRIGKKAAATLLAAVFTFQTFCVPKVLAESINTSGFTEWLGSSVYDYMDSTIPGMSVSIIDMRNGYTMAAGFGWQDKDKKTPVTNDTLFQTGSGISGSVTALTALRLSQEGKLSLDDKITKHLPTLGFSTNPVNGGNVKDVTIRMMLQNVSGLPENFWPDYYSFDEMQEKHFNDFAVRIEGLPMQSKPNENAVVSDVAIAVVGLACARVAWNQYTPAEGFLKLTDDLFEKLEMHNTSFTMKKDTLDSRSWTFDSKGQPTQKLAVASGLMPAVSMWTSARDMQNYMQFMLDQGRYNNKSIITHPKFLEIYEVNEDTIYQDEDKYYGLTWLGYWTPWGTQYRVSGGTGYFHSALILNPEQRLGVYVACNSSAGENILDLAEEIITRLADPLSSVGAWWSHSAISTPDDMEDPENYAGHYYGRYASPVLVTREDETLYITHPDTGTLLAAEEDGRYIIDSSGNWFSLKRFEDRYYLLLNSYPIAVQMPTLGPSGHADQFVGKWTATGDNITYLNRNTLVIEKDINGLARLSGEKLLGFLSGQTAYVYGFGPGGGSILKKGIDDKNQEYLEYEGQRYYRT